MRAKGASGRHRGHSGFRKRHQWRLGGWGTKISLFSKHPPTCHLLSSEGSRMAGGDVAPRSPSYRGLNGALPFQGQMGTALKTPCQVTSPCGGHKGQEGGCCLSHRWQQTVTKHSAVILGRRQSSCRGWCRGSRGKLTASAACLLANRCGYLEDCLVEENRRHWNTKVENSLVMELCACDSLQDSGVGRGERKKGEERKKQVTLKSWPLSLYFLRYRCSTMPSSYGKFKYFLISESSSLQPEGRND